MGKIKMAAAPALQAQKQKHIKSQALAKDTELTVIDLLDRDATLKGGVPASGTTNSLVCTDNEGNRIKVPVRDFMNMTNSDKGTPVYQRSEDGEEIIFPKSIIVKDSKDREYEGEKLYALWMYEGGDDFLQALQAGENPNFADMDRTLKPEFADADPVQDYVIEVSF